MAINDNDFEKVLTGLDNPVERKKLERLYLLYKFYNKRKTENITYDEVEKSLEKINTKFREHIQDPSNAINNKELLNRIIQINNSYKENSLKTEDLLNEITSLENDLQLVPSFPSQIEHVLEKTLNTYKGSRVRGNRWKN